MEEKRTTTTTAAPHLILESTSPDLTRIHSYDYFLSTDRSPTDQFNFNIGLRNYKLS
jgi:hypothetical protein